MFDFGGANKATTDNNSHSNLVHSYCAILAVLQIYNLILMLFSSRNFCIKKKSKLLTIKFRCFETSPYPDVNVRDRLARQINLPESKIQVFMKVNFLKIDVRNCKRFGSKIDGLSTEK